MKLNSPSGFLLATICSALFAACVPSPVNTEVPNALVASPRVIALANASDTGVTSLTLTCGCRFKTKGVVQTGDAAAIRYMAADNADSLMTPHLVKIFAAPNLPSGTYHSQLIFTGGDDNKTDTVSVTLTAQ